MNYEDELEVILWESLKNKFQIKKDDKLFLYLIFRYYIIENKNTIDNSKLFFEFIFKELSITSFNYKNEELSFVGNDNNLNHIFENWKYNYNFESIIKKLDKFNDISKYAINKSSKLKNSKSYKKYLLYFKLNKLNEMFEVKNIKNIKIEGFKQLDFLSLEQNLKQNLKSKDNTTTFISEDDLECYLIKHLDLIENGLVYIKNQYILDEGRIDILAKDINNNIVIIELKIEEDKKIFWQSLYYPMEIQKKFPNKNVRMIIIMPNYPKYLLEPLNKLNVEKFTYDIKVENEKIINLNLRKV